MFCKKCGKEVHEGEKFCASCGTAVGATQTQPVQQVAPQPQGEFSFPKLNLPTDNKSISFYIASGCFLLMTIMMMFVGWFTYSYSGFYKIHIKLLAIGGGTAGWVIASIPIAILTVAFIVCAALYIYGRIKGDKNHKKFGLLGMAIAAALFIVTLIIAVITSIIEHESFYPGFGAYATLVLALAGGVFVAKS